MIQAAPCDIIIIKDILDYDWVFSNTGRVHVLEAFEREFAGGDIEIASGIGLDSFEGLYAASHA
ncbi:MAG: hypothetical protein WBL67_21530 [Nitrososphaeraceae archaeon]